MRYHERFQHSLFYIKWFVLLPVLGGVLPTTLVLHYLLIPLAENTRRHTVIYWWLISNEPLFVFILVMVLLDLAGIAYLWWRLIGFRHWHVLELILFVVVMGSCSTVTYLDWIVLFVERQDLIHVDSYSQDHVTCHLGLDSFTSSESYRYHLYCCDQIDLFCEWQWSTPYRTREWTGGRWSPPSSRLVVDGITHELHVEIDGTILYTLNLVSEE